MKKENDPRVLALESLLRADKAGRYINIESDSSIKRSNMSEADVSLYTSLVYGVTERRITLDYIIERMSKNGLKHIEPRVLMILRLGLYQLMFLDRIPAHAAVNETVSLCKSKGETSFVNAILRNYQRKGKEIVVYPSEEEQPARFLSICYSFPEWITESFITDYGYENAKGICSAMSDRPPCVTLRINTLKTNPATFKEKLTELGFSYTDGIYTDSAIKLAEGSKISDIFGYEEGLFFVQDEASQISSRVLAPVPDSIVIDVCACPGSKSFGASIEMKGKGKVYSFDLHENKLSLVTSSARRLGIENIEVSKRDARDPVPELIGSADAVICDVPCSGLGVMAKKPDIRYKKQEDVEKLASLGLSILFQSSVYVKAGGTLLYSTCTLRADENEKTVDKFLSVHPEFSLCPFSIKSKDGAHPDIESDGTLTLFPHVHSTDGFFMAKMIRSDKKG